MIRCPASCLELSVGTSARATGRPEALGEVTPGASPMNGETAVSAADPPCCVPPEAEAEAGPECVPPPGWDVVVTGVRCAPAGARRAKALDANTITAASTITAPTSDRNGLEPRTGGMPLREPARPGQPRSPPALGGLPTPGTLWLATVAGTGWTADRRARWLPMAAMLRTDKRFAQV